MRKVKKKRAFREEFTSVIRAKVHTLFQKEIPAVFQEFSDQVCRTLKLTISLPRSQFANIFLTVCHTCDILYLSSMPDFQNPGTVALGSMYCCEFI